MEGTGIPPSLEPLLREGHALLAATSGPHHTNTLRALGSLAECLRDLGRRDEAAQLVDEALEEAAAELGADQRLLAPLEELRATL